MVKYVERSYGLLEVSGLCVHAVGTDDVCHVFKRSALGQYVFWSTWIGVIANAARQSQYEDDAFSRRGERYVPKHGQRMRFEYFYFEQHQRDKASGL